MVNVPHNPTGMLPTAGEWAALTGELSARGIHLLADEVYRFLEFDEGDRLPRAPTRSSAACRSA